MALLLPEFRFNMNTFFMKYIIAFILFSVLTQRGVCQDYEIPDYRTKRDNFLKVADKNIRADLASFTIGGIDESFAKLPLERLPVTYVDKDSMVLSNNNIQVIITAGMFDQSKNKVQFYENKHAVKINNNAFYGTKFTIPARVIKSVTAIIDNDTTIIPSTAYADLFEPNFYYGDDAKLRSHAAVYLSADKQRIYIYLVNGTGAGRYEVTWILLNKQYERRVLDYGF